jgi:hypothetical protein
MKKSLCLGCALAAVALVGCRRAEAPRAGTGAEEAARHYFEALVRKDWSGAYRSLDAGSRAVYSEAQFAWRAEHYHRGLGFEPAEAVVRSCEERNGEAVARVNLQGPLGSAPRFHKEAIGLRRGPAGWAVVLPDNFGQVRPRKS